MTGPSADNGPNFYTWITILGICIPYLIIVGPELYNLVHPTFPIINGILFF